MSKLGVCEQAICVVFSHFSVSRCKAAYGITPLLSFRLHSLLIPHHNSHHTGEDTHVIIIARTPYYVSLPFTGPK